MADVQHLGSSKPLAPNDPHLLLVRHRASRWPGDILVTMSGTVADPDRGAVEIAPEPIHADLHFALTQAEHYAARLQIPVIYIRDDT